MPHLLTRRHRLGDAEVREPTVLAIALAALGCIVLLALCLILMAGLPAFGYVAWAFLAIAAALAWLTLRCRIRSLPVAATGRQRWWRRLLIGWRWLFIGLLTVWLGLIVWLAFGHGGPAPPPKADPASIRLITWNIHCGQDAGWPWVRFDWPGRRDALRSALEQAQPDILCVQEATPVQVAFLEAALPEHQRVGFGRDGPAAGGEHCAIFLRQARFERLDDRTFWLEEPIDQPRIGGALDVKRICTWVRLRDRLSGRTLRFDNTHQYLTEAPRQTAAKIILEQLAAGDPRDAVVLTADFNAGPNAPSRQMLLQAGFADAAERAGQPVGQHTFQLYGIGVWNIDGILVDARWRVRHYQVLRVKPHGVYPSDHFALLADLVLAD
jgi:endonuclease/exonuclease/phosphatase family metal-dependent hydrolase